MVQGRAVIAFLKRDGDALNVLLTPEQINLCKDIPELRQLIESSIQ
jgi:hypothetical protein